MWGVYYLRDGEEMLTRFPQQFKQNAENWFKMLSDSDDRITHLKLLSPEEMMAFTFGKHNYA